MILHDGVDIKNFENSSVIQMKLRKLCYVGSFYKGRGIDLIFISLKNFLIYNLIYMVNLILILNQI